MDEAKGITDIVCQCFVGYDGHILFSTILVKAM